MSKESMFKVVVGILLLLAMVGPIESVGLALTIQSPQTASSNRNLNFSEPMLINGDSNSMTFLFYEYGSLDISDLTLLLGYEASSSVEYGAVVESDYPVIDQHLAAYGVSGFTTTYAFLLKWTDSSNPTLESNTLFSTNGAQTYYSVWHPGATPAKIAGRSFAAYNFDIIKSYVPDNETIYVFQVDSVNLLLLNVLDPITVEFNGVNLTIPSPQATSFLIDLPFSEPMSIHGGSNLMKMRLNIVGGLVVDTGVFYLAPTQETRVSAEYGDVAESDYPVINSHLAAYGVSGFTTTYAFLIKWTYANRSFGSRTLFATNGAQTYYSAWHPGATPANTAGLMFGPGNDTGLTISYVPDNQTIYVFQVDSIDTLQLFIPTTTTSAATTMMSANTTTTSTSRPPPGNSAKIVSPDIMMLLAALLIVAITH